MIDIGFAGALIGGVLSLLSPCSVMLLPAFFATAFADPRTLVLRAALFTLGLLATLVPLGMFAGVIGTFLMQYRTTLIAIAAIVLVALGLVQLLAIPLPSLTRREQQTTSDTTSSAAMFLLGAVYAVAGVCSGPILGSVLTVAATGGSSLYGGMLLAVYALGMSLPLLALSLLWRPLGPRLRKWLRPRELAIGRWRNSWAMIASGLVAIGFGALLWTTNGTADLGGVLAIGDQHRLESGALDATAGVSDLAVVLAVAAVSLAGVLIASRMRRRDAAEPAADETRTATDETPAASRPKADHDG